MVKEITIRIKWQSVELEKTFVYYISDRGLMPKYIKGTLTTQQQKKGGGWTPNFPIKNAQKI